MVIYKQKTVFKTIMDKLFETNFRFHVKWHTEGKVQYLLFITFLLVLTKFHFWKKTGH